MGRRRRRTRDASGALHRRRLLFLLGGSLLGIGATVSATGAFSTVEAPRNTKVEVAADEHALVGIELADEIVIGGGAGGCDFGTNDLVVTTGQTDDVETDRDVVVRGNPVAVDIDTSGCVRISSGARLTGAVDAVGSVTVDSGGRIDGPVQAGGDVTVSSGARIAGDVDAGGSVTVHSGGRVDGNVGADGDVRVDSAAAIYGDVGAGESVTVGPGGRITGDVREYTGGSGGNGPQFLARVTNNLDRDATVSVSLLDPADGTLSADGSTGTSVQFYLVAGEGRDVSIAPTSAAGGTVDIRITVEAIGGESRVTLDRSVQTSGP